MANIGGGGGTGYPSAIDTQNPPESGTTLARADVPNDLAAAVIAIETELGTNPAGTEENVKEFLQKEHELDGTHGDITPTSVVMEGSFSFQLGSVVSSAAELDVSGDGNIFDVSGTVGITSFTTKGLGSYIILRFVSFLTLTDDGDNLQLGGGSLHVTAGLVYPFYEYEVGKWRLVGINPSSPPSIGNGTAKPGTFTVVTATSLNGEVVQAGNIIAGAVGQSEIADNAVGQGELKTATQALSVTFSGSPQEMNFTSVGEYGLTFQDNSGTTGKSWTGYVGSATGSTSAYRTHIRVQTNTDPTTLSIRHRYVQASPPYDMGDGPVHTFIYAVIENGTGKIFAMNMSQDPPWIYHAEFGVNRGMIFTDPKTKKRMYRKVKKFDPAALDAQDIFENGPESEIVEYNNDLKMASMNLFPHPYYGQVWTKLNAKKEVVEDTDFWTNHHIALVDPISKVAGRLDALCECGDSSLELFHDGFLKIDNTDIQNRKRPSGVACYSARWRNVS